MNLYVKTKDNVKLFVEDLNPSGKHTILFLHGWPLNHNMWEYQVEYLIELDYRCITFDFRGYGQSDRPVNGYNYNTMALDVKTVIDALKLKDITLIGFSMGAAVALRYLNNYDSYSVSSLCLLSAAAPSFVKTKNWEYGMSEDSISSLIEQNYNNRPNLINNLKPLFFFQYISPETSNWFENMCLKASGWATGKSLLALGQEQLFDDIKKVTMPTLVLHGLHDRICPVEFATYLNKNILNSSSVDLVESGHAGFFEEKNKVTNSIDQFIRQSYPSFQK